MILSLPNDATRRFGREPLKAAHRLHELPLFDDQALIELLDRMPRQNLFALTMGDDPARAEDRRPASHEGVSGARLIEAVKRGKLWLNVTRVDSYEPKYRELLDQLFADLVAQVPGLRINDRRATLLISSPTAQVYYHADGAPTVLWHLRGRKRLYIYPAGDEKFLAQRDLEDIFAGVRTEYVAWRPEFDREAVAFDLAPGELAAWPQNAPHRVVNLEGLNVSLSSEYFTPESRRRARLYNANRFLRRTLRIDRLSTDDRALLAVPKMAVHRLGQALRLDQRNTRRHIPAVRVDPDGEGGVSALPAPAPAITVRRLESLADLRPHREALDKINAESRAPDPFSTVAFYESLLAAEPATRPLFLTAWEGEQPIGYLALRRTEEKFWGFRHAKLEFLAARDVDAPRLVSRPQDESRCAEALYRHLLSRDRDYGMIELRQQYPESPLLHVPPSPLHRVRRFESKENATIPVARFASLAEFHRACLKKHRNNVSRSVRQLMGAGRLEHVSSDDPAATPTLLDLYAGIEARSWKGRVGSSVASNEERAVLLRRLIAQDQPMRIAIDILLLDGVPVAGLINGAYGKMLYALRIAYDEAHAGASPGTAMLLLGVRRAIEGGFEGYNLLSGFGYYKARWLAELRQSQSVQVFRARRAHDWKARLGDLKRRLAPLRGQGPKFNIVKREAVDAAPVEAISAEERVRIAELLRAVPRDRATWLTAGDLQRIMPFEIGPELSSAGA